MESNHTALSDLGVDIISVFSNKVAIWSSTNSVQFSLDTEGGAWLHSSEFETLTKLFEWTFNSEEAFIPTDLMDFDTVNEEVMESNDQNRVHQRSQSKAFFIENRRQTHDHFQKDEDKRPSTRVIAKSETKPSDYNDEGNVAKVSNPLNVHAHNENENDFDNSKRGKVDKEPLQKVENYSVESKYTEGDSSNLLEKERNASKDNIYRSNVGEVQNFANVDAHVQNSIWQNPLGNLSGFVALSNSVTPATPIDLSFLQDNQTSFDKLKEENNTKRIDSVKQKNTLSHKIAAPQRQYTFENEEEQTVKPITPSFDDMFLVNTFQEENQKSYIKRDTENDDFLAIAKENTPDHFDTTTDDLLDALTERIRRDFNRFYP